MKIAIVNLITRTDVEGKIPLIQTNSDHMIFSLKREFEKQGHDAHLFISDSFLPQNRENEPKNVHYVPTILKKIFNPSLLPCTPSLVNLLSNGKFDFILAGEVTQWGTIFSTLSKLKRKTPIFVWQELGHHQKMLSKIPSKIYHATVAKFYLNRFVDLFIPRSPAAGRFLQKAGIKNEKITEPVPHGIDASIFNNTKNIRNPKPYKYILSVSRLEREKGVDILINAFSKIHPLFPDIRLLIKGNGPDYAVLKTLSQDLQISDRVIFDRDFAHKEEMADLYRGASFFVICSRKDEDLLIFSVIESISCGTPVITSDGTHHRDTFYDNKGGLVFPAENVDLLYSSMKRLLDDKELLIEMKKQAFEKSFDYRNENVAGKIIEIAKNFYLQQKTHERA